MDKAKKIISTFIKKDSNSINKNTLMNKSAVPGSVLLHRMYSTLSSEGYHVINQSNIKTYGDFIKAMGKKSADSTTTEKLKNELYKSESENSSLNIQIGIDFEDIINMPIVKDFRRDRFYTDNFSQKEISYCILQASPRANFAGKFSLKEAIVKADNNYKNVPFNKIEILNDKSGKPIFNDFALSVAHTTNQSAAIALKIKKNQNTNTNEIKKIVSSILNTTNKDKKQDNEIVNYMALVISIISIVIVLFNIL